MALGTENKRKYTITVHTPQHGVILVEENNKTRTVIRQTQLPEISTLPDQTLRKNSFQWIEEFSESLHKFCYDRTHPHQKIETANHVEITGIALETIPSKKAAQWLCSYLNAFNLLHNLEKSIIFEETTSKEDIIRYVMDHLSREEINISILLKAVSQERTHTEDSLENFERICKRSQNNILIEKWDLEELHHLLRLLVTLQEKPPITQIGNQLIKLINTKSKFSIFCHYISYKSTLNPALIIGLQRLSLVHGISELCRLLHESEPRFAFTIINTLIYCKHTTPTHKAPEPPVSVPLTNLTDEITRTQTEALESEKNNQKTKQNIELLLNYLTQIDEANLPIPNNDKNHANNSHNRLLAENKNMAEKINAYLKKEKRELTSFEKLFEENKISTTNLICTISKDIMIAPVRCTDDHENEHTYDAMCIFNTLKFSRADIKLLPDTQYMLIHIKIDNLALKETNLALEKLCKKLNL